MDKLSLADKQAQFDEYFMIAHDVPVNIRVLESEADIPQPENIEAAMPYAFRMASEMASIEAQALRPLRNLSEHAEVLTEYLNHQAKKIDLMMHYILQQQDEEEHRYRSIKFGGGGTIIQSNHAMDTGMLVELKLFLTEESAAVFCFGEVIACQQHEDDYHIAFIFRSIREQDQELLVRASLHLQTQQLRKRAQNKQQE